MALVSGRAGAMVRVDLYGHNIDSESEEWMMTGMAVRMAVDLGLHLVSWSDSCQATN